MTDEKNKYQIRKISIARNIGSLFFMQNKNFPASVWRRQGYEKYFLDKKEHPICVAAYGKDGIIGFAIGKYFLNEPGAYILATLVVREDLRRLGIAEKIIRRFLKETLKFRDVRKVFLHFRKSKKLQGFYEKYGFKKVKENGRYSDNEEKFCMEISREEIKRFYS